MRFIKSRQFQLQFETIFPCGKKSLDYNKINLEKPLTLFKIIKGSPRFLNYPFRYSK